MSPTISVILPVYNSEAYLGLAVDSVLAQTFRDFELIAIEGGSTDRSRAILGEFAARDARVRVITQSARGLVGALNEGIAAGRGEFLARMDADDISHPERFTKQLVFLRGHPDIAVVGSTMTLIDAEGLPIRDIDYPIQPSEVARSLECGSALAHPAVMMRTEAVRQMHGYRAVLDHAEDYDLWLRMAERFQLANLPDRLLSYRHHAGKRGCLFAFEQELHTQFARLSAAARRAGRPDPLDGLTSLALADIGRFALSAAEREQLALSLLGPLQGAQKPEELEWIGEIMGLIETPPVDRARVARQKIELAKLFLGRRRPAAAIAWIAAAIRTDPRQGLVMLGAVGTRGRRKLSAIGQRFVRFVFL
jgi:GT2 family glycosyltransferase